MIAHLGTFDVENYGDLLYPIIFAKLVNQQVRHYSLVAGIAPNEAGFETESIRSLFQNGRAAPRTLVIGGGDILRTDWELVARHYGRNSRLTQKRLRDAIGTGAALGYAVSKNLPRVERGRFFAKRFRARWMDYPAAGPFLLHPKTLPKQSAVAYISCGVPHEFPDDQLDQVRDTLEHASFIALRDEQSAAKLVAAGVKCELRVAPDLTVTLSDHFDHSALIGRARRILSRFGVREDVPVLCFQSQPYPGFLEDDILRELRRYKERRNAEVVALPLGYCHGDHEFLQRLAKQSNGIIKYADVHSIFDMLAIIAASDVFVGTSLHGNITAFSFGIPHVFGPLPVAKAEGFLNVTKLPVELKMRSWSELNDKIDNAVMLGRDFFSTKASEAKARVYEVVGEMMCRIEG
ncbi:MAG TPA: polysaccharide pyruvyl transferase family protein [Pyrinomonadaceae bacterium]|nr:polysaccharide pyruvyl transferase family protein [Pyrinomonadaceae bacterium]